MENFRKPNFELVADILFFMIKLYDPETTISDRVEFENERVDFLTKIAALMATKARLKLNTKKLYASDGRAVQELLKLASLLYR
jgi:clusterin-associated protein 1